MKTSRLWKTGDGLFISVQETEDRYPDSILESVLRKANQLHSLRNRTPTDASFIDLAEETLRNVAFAARVQVPASAACFGSLGAGGPLGFDVMPKGGSRGPRRR